MSGDTRRTIAIGEDIGVTFDIEETDDGADIELLEGTRNLRSATCNQEPNDAITTGLYLSTSWTRRGE
ncbi:MAG: hypothetical protein AAFZ52_06515 [Bacteroidota bacterium]